MTTKSAVVLTANDIDQIERRAEQRLNPRSRFYDAWLAKHAGLTRVGLSRARIPPGGEAFAYHAHHAEEEWLVVLSGRALARIDGEEVELRAGDFAAFPAPQVPHLMTNPYDEDCVYLYGGEPSRASDVVRYPELGKTYVVVRGTGPSAFHELGPAEHPFAVEAPRWQVLGCRGCGSVIAEAALVLAGIAYDREEVDYTEDSPARDRLRGLNPLVQVPTVVLPDGAVMTETAAIALYVDELAPEAGLLPPPRDPRRRDALRWLVFLIGAIYPTFTYGDEPEKWVGEAGPALREATHAHRRVLWQQVEAAARAPWFLGARFSLLDVYLGAMTHWRPRRAWFAEHCPKLFAIATAVDREPRLAALWAANFA